MILGNANGEPSKIKLLQSYEVLLRSVPYFFTPRTHKYNLHLFDYRCNERNVHLPIKTATLRNVHLPWIQLEIEMNKKGGNSNIEPSSGNNRKMPPPFHGPQQNLDTIYYHHGFPVVSVSRLTISIGPSNCFFSKVAKRVRCERFM